MGIKILIKRTIPSNISNDVAALLLELRSRARKQPGYISGETLTQIGKPEQSLTIGRWDSLASWEKWAASGERAEIQNKIDMLLGRSPEYEFYE